MNLITKVFAMDFAVVNGVEVIAKRKLTARCPEKFLGAPGLPPQGRRPVLGGPGSCDLEKVLVLASGPAAVWCEWGVPPSPYSGRKVFILIWLLKVSVAKFV
jgi:hypothetical protein